MLQSVQLCKYVTMCVNVTLWDKDLQFAVIVYKCEIINVTFSEPFFVMYTCKQNQQDAQFFH